ncbi:MULTISPECIES: adenylate kinase [Thermoanaerobacterium]|uniref:Adenylate kinase n=1 Tax=Thermoanaerobacterium butyriciformans TaxID=1702242 RepID=A0ABS4NEA5_9THEO|nr:MULTISPECIES: adenylate kinase [Thermoanaerobacterium]MBE0068843.1 adenylate kinase [Thermoanaerobacterium thermosaccharolyticum]MBE0228721.1 adenylate kinase [Thermoanaerobacterium thermosaccharolyticum]MBP2071987.1 adenylate kinase [Thermoanaerobacterium butyriciformans]MCP2241073.1 adenylate kinase [Thermoanaerobacterium thermosaccharolyticum]
MRIILLGPPGAGKGTQAESITRDYKIPHISTGDIFRYNIKNNTELGKLAKQYIDKGMLVPDDVTNKIVEDRLSKDDCKDGFLLDGYPRNVVQAESLGKYLGNKNLKIDHVLNIIVDRDELVKRLSGRRVCPSCGATYHIVTKPPKVEGICDNCGEKLIQRMDDNIESVLKRLEVYEDETKPLVEYYGKLNLIRNIDGNKPVNEVYKEIQALIGDEV